MSVKKYREINVYEAVQQRLDFIFSNFDRVYLSFSGGKDSGILLNLCLQFMKQNNISKRLGIMILDNEANYTHTLNFMHRILSENREYLDIYWCCLPITLPCTVSAFMTDWQCWGVQDEPRWVRPMPTEDYIININNHPFPFFRENMQYYEFWDKFGEWYSQGKRTACLIGIRTDESLNRFRAIMNEDKETLLGEMWTKKNMPHVYNCYPIYDWTVSDIWVANYRFEFLYNELYDIFYMAGLDPYQMRVASPFMSESKSSLNLYRVIDPGVWARLCARVMGANFVATYGKQINYHSFRLPPGHTWKSFTKFLLDTLPDETAENFKRRFIQSFRYWGRVGRGLPQRTIQELNDLGIQFKLNGKTPHGSKQKERVIIQSFPDHLDELSCHNSDVASWKRFAITILKNDHVCKYLGLAPTKEQAERQKQIQEKYRRLL
jgi:predicted phosphoadenosine phosphosulfate sulfurtransferase